MHSAVGWGSKADLELEIQDLAEAVDQHEADKETALDLLDTAFIGERGVLLTRETYRKIQELLQA